jgi:hypothetical protein
MGLWKFQRLMIIDLESWTTKGRPESLKRDIPLTGSRRLGGMGTAADARGQVSSAACKIEGADARRWVDKMVGEGGQYILGYYNLPRILIS